MRDNSKILICFGLQNDYLKNKDIVPKIVDKINWYEENQYPYYFVQDTYYNDEFCKIHTDGWQFIDEVQKYTVKNNVIKSFDSLANLYWGEIIISKYSIVELCGLYTDRNIVSNAIVLKAKNPWTKFIVDSNLCEGTSPEKNDSGLDILESNKIEVKFHGDI